MNNVFTAETIFYPEYLRYTIIITNQAINYRVEQVYDLEDLLQIPEFTTIEQLAQELVDKLNKGEAL